MVPSDVKLEKLFQLAEQNTTYDKNGHAVISKDDPWIEETEWDELYNQLEDE